MPDNGLAAVVQSLDATVAASEATAAARLLQGLAQHLEQQSRNASYNSQLQMVGSSCCGAMLSMLGNAEVPIPCYRFLCTRRYLTSIFVSGSIRILSGTLSACVSRNAGAN